ncbi:hypothetical protein ACXR0O_13950 [Verrucomicrobiota bacterium sgz303538]
MINELKALVQIIREPLRPAEPLPKEFETVLPAVEAREAYLRQWAEESGEKPEAMVSIPYSVARDLLKGDEALAIAVNALKEISGNPIHRDNRFPGHRDLDISRFALDKIQRLIPIGSLVDETAKRLVEEADTRHKSKVARKS